MILINMKNYQNTNYTNAITKTSPSPGPLSPGGASAIRTPLAVCPLFPATSLRGPEHRSRRVPSPANICGGFWLFTSGGARALRPEGVGPPGRTRPGAVLVDDTLALPLPVPARAPLLAQLGVLACEAAFPTLSSVGLQLPVFPRVPFLACELAFLVCTVQIKVVSI